MDWAALNEHIGLISAILGSTVGAAGSVWAVVKFCIKPIKVAWIKLKGEYKEIRRDISHCKKELEGNSGGSIKDHISLIKDSVLRIERWGKARLSHEILPYFDTNEKGSIVWINLSFVRLFSVSEYELLGMGVRNFIDKKDKERVAREWAAAIENCIDLRTSFRVICGENKMKCVQCDAFVVRGSKGECIGYTGVLIEKESSVCD